MQTTLVFCKPDAVQRGLLGRIVDRFERKGFQIVAMKMLLVPRELAEAHYAEHEGKPFYESLLDFISDSPVLAMAIQGVDAVAVCRKLVGATNGRNAEPGTIRGDFGLSTAFNLIHASDSAESAERELAMWFPEGLLDYERQIETWTYSPDERSADG